jgi:hypothetical protein
MPRYVIHIGPHKTGSTYLQAAFEALRPQLMERGIWSAEQWQGEERLGHHRLVRRLRAEADDGLAEEFASLNASSHQTILLSAEDLADLGSEHIARFKSCLGESPARVVFYCRRWSELLSSGWKETIKHGHTITFPEFLSGQLANPAGSNVINYGQTLGRYAEHFGMANISLVPYSNIVDNHGDIFAHFCENFLAWKNPPKPPEERMNVSLDPVEAEIIRALNAIERERSGRSSEEIYFNYSRNLGKFDTSLVVSAMQRHTAIARMNEALGSLKLLHAELAQAFGSLLVEPRSGLGLFVPRRAEIPYLRQDYLLCDGVVAALKDIHRRIGG